MIETIVPTWVVGVEAFDDPPEAVLYPEKEVVIGLRVIRNDLHPGIAEVVSCESSSQPSREMQECPSRRESTPMCAVADCAIR